MNKRLFEIRNLGRGPIALLIVVLLTVLAAFFFYQARWKNETNFLKFHGQSDYSPMNSKGTGFYGKVNSYLQQALLDTSNTTNTKDITHLDDVYKRLKFYYPSDTSDYLVSVEDIRLIDFVPRSGDQDEAAFYFNSDFKTVIEKQKRNLTQKYFNIEWSRSKDRIISITIDTTLFNLSLQNEHWNGILKFTDPFAKVDPAVMYVITDNTIVPLFSSNVNPDRFFNSENGWRDIDPFRRAKYSSDELENLFKLLNHPVRDSSSTIRVNFADKDNSNTENSIRFLNTTGRLYIQSQEVDFQVYGGGNIINAVHDTTVMCPSTFTILKILLKPRGSSKQYKLYLSKVSPYSIASKPMNEGITGERLNIDTGYLDLSAAQQVRQLTSGISNRDTVPMAELSTNIILSRYLEQKIKEKVAALYNDKTMRLREDDVFEMSMCLMDVATGEIIAAPFYSNEFDKNNFDELVYQRNFNLSRHDIGSTFKPLISLGAYLKYRSLEDFQLLPANTKFDKKNGCSILGYPTLKYGVDKKDVPKLLFWSAGPVYRKLFLSESHDNFPLALTMLALTEQGDPAYHFLSSNHLDNGAVNNLYHINGDNTSRITFKADKGRIIFKDISNASFINIISNLYSVEAENRDSTFNSITYDAHCWDSLRTRKKIFYSLYPDIVYLGTDKFGHARSGLEDFKKFELFVLGQGDNLWTNVKLAEAYSRLLSAHKVNATFLRNEHGNAPYLFTNPVSLFQSPGNNHYRFELTPVQADTTWQRFMRDWRGAVQMNGRLLRKGYENFCKGVEENKDYYFYCKTGTPQENKEHENNKVFKKGKDNVWWDEGLFVFGITNKDSRYPKGITGVVYIKHLSLDEIKKGVESSTARDFLDAGVYKKIMFYNRNRFVR